MNNNQAKVVELKGEGREAQEHAQALITEEFLRTDALPRHKVMVEYATGTGKAKGAIEAAIAYCNMFPQSRLFIGVYTESARDNVWVNQIKLWGRNHDVFKNANIECYASMGNIKGEHFGIVILDEAHHLTDRSFVFFENNTFEAILILTATEPRDKHKQLLIYKLTGGRKLIITTDQAVNAGILNDFEIYIIQLEMDDTKGYKLFKNSNTLYTEKTGYLKKCRLVEDAKFSGDPVRAKFANINRQRYLGDLETKTLATLYLQEQFRQRNQRFVTFANSKKQANVLGKYVYHSDTDDKHYKAFLHNQIDELVSIKQLKESENFDNLGRGVHVQVNSNPGDMLQITGRLLRLPVGQISKLYVLCMMGTMDEKWVNLALSKTNTSKIFTFDLKKELYWK